MTATASTMGPMTGNDHRRPCGLRGEGRWNAPNAIATVLALMFFGPLGLFVLAWVISGRDVREIPGAARRLWAMLFGGADGHADGSGFGAFAERSRTGNVVFDDYQRTQHERIREIREEIRTRTHRFAEFRAAARRQADREEFERFMASAPEGRTEG